MDLVFTSTEGVNDQMIDYRKELGARVPATLHDFSTGINGRQAKQLVENYQVFFSAVKVPAPSCP